MYNGNAQYIPLYCILGISIQYILPTLQYIYHTHCLSKAPGLLIDPSHPAHPLFSVLPVRKNYQTYLTTRYNTVSTP